MNRSGPAVLIVDDDKSLRETISAILQSQGYRMTSVANANEAIEKTRTQFFDIILLDVKLPDMDGTQLLSHLQKTAPETLKIIITGYPSVTDAAEALDIGANSYLTKPIDPDHLLKTIKNKLQEHKQKEKITREKLAEWVKTRVRKTQSTDFEEFLERNAATLTSFALNKTEAKIYIGLNALGVASASEIASLTEIRREEVYRTLPELEKRGLVTRKFGAPRRFAAVKPKIALKILIRARNKAMKEEANDLRRKKDDLISQLEKASYGIEEENSIEALSQQDNVLIRLTQMTKKAKRQVVIASPFEQLEKIFPKSTRRNLSKDQISMRIIIDSSTSDKRARELDNVHTLKPSQFPLARGNKIELRKMEMLPFNLLMIDGKEAIWGEFQPEDANRKILWTNDSTQIEILKMAFENLWQESGKTEEDHDLS